MERKKCSVCGGFVIYKKGKLKCPYCGYKIQVTSVIVWRDGEKGTVIEKINSEFMQRYRRKDKNS